MFVYLRISTYVEIFISVALNVAHDPPSGSKLAPLPDPLTKNGYHVIPLNGSVTIGVFNCMSSLIPLRFVLPQSLYHQPINPSYQKSKIYRRNSNIVPLALFDGVFCHPQYI